MWEDWAFSTNYPHQTVSQRQQSGRHSSRDVEPMNFRALFSRSENSRRSRIRRIRHDSRGAALAHCDRLEQRTLLAGNLTAQLVGQTAFLVGDNADNSVELLVDNGNVVIRGLDNTTINGAAADFVITAGASSMGSLTAFLGNGNDRFVIDAVAVNGNVAISGGAGADEIGVIGNASLNGHATLSGNAGTDRFSLQDSTFAGTVRINGGDNADTIALSTATLGSRLLVSGGKGNDDIVVDNSTIAGNTHIVGQRGHDDIVIRDSTLSRNLLIRGNSGNDVVMIDSSTIGNRSRIVGSRGADTVVIQGTSRLTGRSRIRGGSGGDTFETGTGVVLGKTRNRSFAGTVADPALVASRITDATTGALGRADQAVALFGSQLTLSVDSATVSEGAGNGAVTLTVARNTNTAAALTVNLASSDTAKLTLQQTTLTIPAGQTSAVVLLNPQNNDVVDADSVVTIMASGAGFADRSVDVTVTNDDGEALTLTATESQVQEDTGTPSSVGVANAVTYNLTRSGPTDQALTVQLSSSIAGVVDVPTQVTIPAGSQTFQFSVNTIADLVVESDATVVLTASAAGLQSSQADVVIIDNDTPRLSVAFSAPTVTEAGTNATASVTVSRNTDTADAITVTLTSSDGGSLTVNGQTSVNVTIPAGQLSATATAASVQETVDDGDVSVAVTASATGFTDGSNTIFVIDDDTQTLTLNVIDNVISEDAGTGAIGATLTRDSVNISTELIVTLASTGDLRVAVPSTVTISAGQTQVNVTFDTIDNNVVDQPATGLTTVSASADGFTGDSADITVNDDDVATITISPSTLNVAESAGPDAFTLAVQRTDTSTAEIVTLTYSNFDLVTGPPGVSFAIGEQSKTASFSVIDNALFAANDDVTITASASGHPDVSTTISVVNDDALTLSTDVSSNTTAESVGTLITRNETFTITGLTAPGATVQVDTDGDGDFTEASTIAASDGTYSVDATLVHDSNNNGLNTVQVQSVIPSESVDTTSDLMNVHLAIGSVVRFQTNQDLNNDQINDFYDVELLDTDAPVTVDNFLQYTTDAGYDNVIVHRSPPAFVIQGGGFTVNNGAVSSVVTRAPITNEFDSANPNVRGTLSMAQLGGQPNSGTSQWFVNVVDNSTNLDAAQHTVFGEVIGSGMQMVDAINSLSVFDLSNALNQSALSQTPLVTSPLTALTGSVSLSANSDVVDGNGTLFTSEVQVGDILQIGGASVFVTAITSDVQLTVDVQANSDQPSLAATLFTAPSDSDYVVFSDIGEILDSV
jgi:cyclophilin family peptidyl-prolyl cis-trans isomerase/carbon monoxide dehydrogenase subunit G